MIDDERVMFWFLVCKRHHYESLKSMMMYAQGTVKSKYDGFEVWIDLLIDDERVVFSFSCLGEWASQNVVVHGPSLPIGNHFSIETSVYWYMVRPFPLPLDLF